MEVEDGYKGAAEAAIGALRTYQRRQARFVAMLIEAAAVIEGVIRDYGAVFDESPDALELLCHLSCLCQDILAAVVDPTFVLLDEADED